MLQTKTSLTFTKMFHKMWQHDIIKSQRDLSSWLTTTTTTKSVGLDRTILNYNRC